MLKKIIRNGYDFLALIWGIISLIAVLSHSGEYSEFEETAFIHVPAALGVIYLIHWILCWCFDRVRFDWHLINGHFLRKVCCLVILMPFLIMMAINFSGGQSGLDETFGENQAFKAQYDSHADNLISHEDDSDRKETNLLWTIFVHYVDPGLQINASPEGNGRKWSALIAILGIFLLNGLLVSSIIAWIDQRKEQWTDGETLYPYSLRWSLRGHYVIIGGNDMVSGIVRQLLESEKNASWINRSKYILIQTSQEVETFRRELFSSLSEKEQKKIIIYYGNRTSEEDIAELKLKKAKEVYLIGENSRSDDIESYHDTLNIKCLQLIKGYCDNHRMSQKLMCRVMFEYQTTFSVFQFSEISTDIKKHIDFKPFNFYEMWAQKVLISKKVGTATDYLPLEGVHGITEDSDEYVHLVIVGMSRMGTSMAIEAAHLAHYPNYESKKVRTKITFIDSNAVKEKEFFIGRFKDLFSLSNWRYGSINDTKIEWKEWIRPSGFEYLGGDILDIEWEFINGGVEDQAIQDYLKESSCLTSKMTIAMCVPEASKCLAHALYLDRQVYENVLQILVYNRCGDSLIKEMVDHQKKQYNPFNNKIKAFGMAAECYERDLVRNAEFIASELNNEYGRIKDSLIASGKLVDTGVQTLDKSAVAKWWSSVYSANTLWTKLRCIQWDGISEILTDRQLDILEKVEHNRWTMEQLLMRCRPVTEEEQAEIIRDRTKQNDFKGRMAHFDICSNERLAEIDEPVIAYDRGFSEVLPKIYKQLNTNV